MFSQSKRMTTRDRLIADLLRQKDDWLTIKNDQIHKRATQPVSVTCWLRLGKDNGLGSNSWTIILHIVILSMQELLRPSSQSLVRGYESLSSLSSQSFHPPINHTASLWFRCSFLIPQSSLWLSEICLFLLCDGSEQNSVFVQGETIRSLCMRGCVY